MTRRRPLFWAGTGAVVFGAAALGAVAFASAQRPKAPPALAVPPVAASAEVHTLRPLARRVARNRIAYVPPQCFTKTQDAPGGRVHNPCYVCHAAGREPNYADESALQLSYDFPAVRAGRGAVNDWSNCFRDRRQAIAAISDADVSAYVERDNYASLRRRLLGEPEHGDANENGRWEGYAPDAAFHFDARGFDRDAAGHGTGWRAFAYYPVPGAFMPTNGSFDDVLIRLPAAFREDERGRPDDAVYGVNFAIIEALVRRADVTIDPIDERPLGFDLDGDGELGRAERVAFRFEPLAGVTMSYVGRARAELAAGKLHLAAGLLPEGTEFLHSVRYLAVDASGQVRAAPRMKELRYAKKRLFLPYAALADHAQREAKEEALNPDRPDRFLGDAEHGLSNGAGWSYQGFIEDRTGELRPQSYEETLFCAGCHGRLGVTTDGVFAFPRKLERGPARGWYHFSTAPDAPLPDPPRADGRPEYATYLEQNPSGDEFRANDEVLAKFFGAAGAPRPEAFAALARDVRTLFLPTPARALALDKAYWLVVREQSFSAGRDALLGPAANVLREVAPGTPTGIETPLANPGLAADGGG